MRDDVRPMSISDDADRQSDQQARLSAAAALARSSLARSSSEDRYAPTARTQVRESVFKYIQGQIVSGVLAPGSLLRLAPVAKAVNSSTTPVREALLLLAQEGWVVHEPNRGFRVLPVLRSDIDDTYLVYSYCAGELAARAARKLTVVDVEELQQLDSQMREMAIPDLASSELLTVAVQTLNEALHEAIYAAAASPRVLAYCTTSLRYIPRYGWGVVPGWLALNRDGHTPIIAALAERDGEKAREEMALHIQEVGKILIAHLDHIGFWASEEPQSQSSPAVGALLDRLPGA